MFNFNIAKNLLATGGLCRTSKSIDYIKVDRGSVRYFGDVIFTNID